MTAPPSTADALDGIGPVPAPAPAPELAAAANPGIIAGNAPPLEHAVDGVLEHQPALVPRTEEIIQVKH